MILSLLAPELAEGLAPRLLAALAGHASSFELQEPSDMVASSLGLQP